jgi:hypothetical protein
VTAVGVAVGVLGELDVGAGQQCSRGLQGKGLIGLQEQDVVTVDRPGDQPGGFLVRV